MIIMKHKQKVYKISMSDNQRKMLQRNRKRNHTLRQVSIHVYAPFKEELTIDLYNYNIIIFLLFSEFADQPCQYHNAIFPPVGTDYFVLECYGPGIPTVTLYKTNFPMPRLIYVLQNNTLLRVSCNNFYTFVLEV